MAEKKWEDLTIRDNFIFGKVMETRPDLCKRLLEKILHIQIKELSYPEREKPIEVRHDSKGIRLDLLVQETNGTRIFDVEMQQVQKDDLPRRIRYYQGLLDMDAMDKGKYYWTLSASYILFICNFDYFGKGRHIYTFRPICEEDSTIRLQDGTTKIFLNAKGTMEDVEEDVKAFLDYVAGRSIKNPLVEELDETVERVKQTKEWRSEYMKYEHELAAREHWAREEGREEGLVKSIRNIMDSLGMSLEQAMDAVKVPTESRAHIASRLQ